MNFEIEKSKSFSGKQTSIYTIRIEGEQLNIFERFLEENKTSFKSEIYDILNRLEVIAYEEGAKEIFFKKWEGKPGDGVCALYDQPHKNLRLYCIRYDKSILILGGGGYKPKNIKALQEDKKLKYERDFLVKISELITKRIIDKEIRFSNDWLELEGNLKFRDEYE